MMNKTERGFMRRFVVVMVLALVIFCKPNLVAYAAKTPAAVWWDDNADKAGIARCSDVEGAKEYKFTLYKGEKVITEGTSKEPKYDFAKDLAQYFNQRWNDSFYVRVQATDSQGTSRKSDASNCFEEKQWIETFYYRSGKGDNISTQMGDYTNIDVYIESCGPNALPYLSTGCGSKITHIEWEKTENLKEGERTTAKVTIVPTDGCTLVLPKGGKSVNLHGNASLYKYSRKGQTFTLEIDYHIPGKLEAPVATYWDDKADKAGMARCTEVEHAKEYIFTLYRGREAIATVKNTQPKYDFVHELADNYSRRNNDSYYFTVQVTSDKEGVEASNFNASQDFTTTMWKDLKEYCNSKKIELR